MRSWARCTCLCLRRSNSSPSSGGDGGRGRCLWRKDTSPCDPLQKRGGISISTPSRHGDSRPLFGAANRAASPKQARFIRRWRRFACFPHTPLKRLKGAGLRPLPFGNPSRNRTGERVAKRGARKEEQSPCVNRPGKMRPRLQMRGIRSLFLGGTAHSAEAWQVSAAWIRTTPAFKQKRRLLAPVLRPSVFFFHRARRILFRQDEKEWGVHPRPARPGRPPSPPVGGSPSSELSRRSIFALFHCTFPPEMLY